MDSRSTTLQARQLLGLFHRLFDGHPAHVCALDPQGRVLAVNHAWAQFGEQNGLTPGYRYEGKNYVEECERAAAGSDPYAQLALVGLLDVMHSGRANFAMVYPCHAPQERRWFKLWVEPQMPHAQVIIVAHSLERVEPVALPYQSGVAQSTCIARG